VSLAEAKAHLSGLIDDVARRDERVTITKHGRPAAVLMSHDAATSLDATLEIMSDPEFYAEILRNRRALDRGEGRVYDLDERFGEAVSTSRAAAPTRSKAKGARRKRQAPGTSRAR
jgi:prevent-host-death family protein